MCGLHGSEQGLSERLLPLSFHGPKIKTVVGHEVLSFFDLYKGYHQALMDFDDAPKTPFITVWGIFSYKNMSFGVKNAKATYQRLVDRVFQK